MDLVFEFLKPFLSLFVVDELGPGDDDFFDLIFFEFLDAFFEFGVAELKFFYFGSEGHIVVFIEIDFGNVLIFEAFNLFFFVVNVSFFSEDLIIHVVHLFFELFEGLFVLLVRLLVEGL